MIDYQFYHAGFDEPKGPKRAVIPFRRLLRRLLRPMLVRLADLLQSLGDRADEAARRLVAVETRMDRAEDRLQAAVAFGWDHVAVVRRLAALEDEVAALREAAEGRSRAA